MADRNKTPIGLSLCIIGPAKYLPTAIIPVIRAKINIGLAPDFSRRGLSHC
jgi:hypothetical protein